MQFIKIKPINVNRMMEIEIINRTEKRTKSLIRAYKKNQRFRLDEIGISRLQYGLKVNTDHIAIFK